MLTYIVFNNIITFLSFGNMQLCAFLPVNTITFCKSVSVDTVVEEKRISSKKGRTSYVFEILLSDILENILNKSTKRHRICLESLMSCVFFSTQ